MILNQSMVAADGFEKHLVNRKRKKHWGLKAAGFTLMLTSMVDMFSMLVVFLLQTFSSSPEILVTKGVELPNSITPAQVREAPVLAISSDGFLYLDQEKVGKTEDISKKPNGLLKKLNVIKKNWAKSHTTPFTGEINLQADKEIQSTVVAQIMGILTSSQFQSIELAVVGHR
ncbi:MAG: biopolymer transporter ExbD [Bdellovibrionota bacterium]|jgi:biopolymer transport protein ExbD|nr:biopolymer transporter ExbD [Bdellovibrionota bacterium]